MDEILRRIGQGWDPERVDRLLTQTKHRIRRGRRRRAAVSTLVGLLAVCACIVALSRWNLPGSGAALPPTGLNAPAPCLNQPATRVVEFHDGSTVELARGAEVEVRVVSASELTVRLKNGRGRFQVIHHPERQFVVEAGRVTVLVVGTEFSVELRGEATWVEVSRGRVRVGWTGDERTLGAGEHGLFPPPAQGMDAPLPVADAGAHPSAREAFRASAERRNYSQAFALMQSTPSAVGNTVEDLMLAADVARLSGHPGQAVPFLERVVRDHPRDDRAALAAFTLGRTLLGLGRTEEASRAFSQVSVLAPGSALAEDALARRVEAAYRAGDRGAARRLAEQYLNAHPNGRRRATVREQGGLD